MEIVEMKISNYQDIFKLWTSTPGMGLRNLDDSKEGIDKFLMRNPTTNFIAEDDGKIIGSILCGHDGRRGYIYHTAVDIRYRGKGIGKKLVNSVINALKREGINKAALVVFTNNEVGNRFWRSMEWEKREDLNYYNLSINKEN
ncbi:MULTISPECIES: GNAT family N-acetyltransferase [unclassified Clostridium]|uniref:GNAT family N-acetyltransferase n=1 Tax=unclassified Clostridium TaxID=2614128 RepID=UPI0032179EF5